VDLQEQESFSARIRAQIEAQLSSLQQIIALPTPPQLPSLQPLAPETATAALQIVGSPQLPPQPQPQPPPLAATHPSERGRAGYIVTGVVQTPTPLELARQQLETAERLHRLVYPRATGQQVRPLAPFHAAQALPFGALQGLPPPQPPLPWGALSMQTTPWSWGDFITDFQRRQFVLLQTLRDIEGAQRSHEESRGRNPQEGLPGAGD